MSDLEFETPYLNDYLRMVEDTESPRLYHIWSAIMAVSSALGRRCWLPFGIGDIYPNHFILLVGNPATRKSTAANIMRRLLKSSTGVRFAPQDTAGHRQGIVAAMVGNQEESKEFLDAQQLGARDNSLMSLTELEEITNDPEEETAQFISEADKHHIVVVSSEFSRFIGQNNSQMLDFLTTMYDGEPYEYQLKTSLTEMKKPLMNLIGATTPTSLSHSMPPYAGGQGILSRMILVYGHSKYKEIARPTLPDVQLVARVKEVLHDVYFDCNGPFDETEDAITFSKSLYGRPLEIADSRFGFYQERRYTHLIKLALCLCASRRSRTVTRSDYEEADRILRATERGMPDALGEFGLNPLAILKQEMLEQLRHAQGPVTLDEVVSLFHRDAKSHEITEVLNDLKRAKQINMFQSKSGVISVSAIFTKEKTEDVIMQILAEK